MDMVNVLDTTIMDLPGGLAVEWEVSVGVEAEVVSEEELVPLQVLGLRQDMEELEGDKLNHHL